MIGSVVPSGPNWSAYNAPVNPQTPAIPGYVNFSGTRDGQLLKRPTWYPESYPQFQISKDKRLCFWDWINDSQKTSQEYWKGQMFYNVPLSEFELTRFRRGYDALKQKGVADVLPWKTRPATDAELVTAGAMETMGGQIWGFKSTTGAFAQFLTAGAPKITVYNGEWVWEKMNGGFMIITAAQYYVDLFLKTPWDVNAATNYGKNYLGQLYEAMAKGKLNIYLSNINFFVKVQNEPTFLDKLLEVWIPLAIATAVSIVSAGAGTPVLVALVASMAAGQIVKDVNKQVKENAETGMKAIDQQIQATKDAAEAQKKIADSELQKAGVIPGNTNLWLFAALGLGIVILSNKKRK